MAHSAFRFEHADCFINLYKWHDGHIFVNRSSFFMFLVLNSNGWWSSYISIFLLRIGIAAQEKGMNLGMRVNSGSPYAKLCILLTRIHTVFHSRINFAHRAVGGENIEQVVQIPWARPLYFAEILKSCTNRTNLIIEHNILRNTLFTIRTVAKECK